MINRPFFNFTIAGIGLLGTLQGFIGAIYLLMFVLDFQTIINLIYAVTLVSGAIMFFGFYFVLKFIREYMDKNGYEMEETY